MLDAANGKLLRSLDDPTSSILSLAIAPNEWKLAGGCRNGHLGLWHRNCQLTEYSPICMVQYG